MRESKELPPKYKRHTHGFFAFRFSRPSPSVHQSKIGATSAGSSEAVKRAKDMALHARTTICEWVFRFLIDCRERVHETVKRIGYAEYL